MKNSGIKKTNEIPENICACCGMTEVYFFDFCDVCGWQNDSLQNKYPDFKGGANQMSLNEAKKAYKKGEEIF